MSHLKKEEILSTLAQTAVSGDIVQWDGTNWVSVNFPINLTGLASDDILVFDGLNFVPSRKQSITESATAPVSPLLNDLWKNSSATSVSGVGSGNLAYWNGSTWIDFFGDSVFLRVSSNIAQTIVGASATAVKSFNIVESDNFSGWSVAMNHYVVPEDGVYQISSGLFCICNFSASLNSGVNIFIQVNGVISTRLGGGGVFAPTAPIPLGVTPAGSVAIRLLAGQTVRILCENGFGLSQSQSTALSRDNYLTIAKIGEI